ncbi:MAG TPA: SEC-C metal-binding domain-containing protein [Myxococcota bacterium]|nr:SEC-C metal-binding domain-containing protein [Myxococcota bacterium]
MATAVARARRGRAAHDFLETIERRSLEQLAARVVGTEVRGEPAVVRARLRAALKDVRALRRLVESLPAPGRAALEILCEADGLVPEQCLTGELRGALGAAGAAAGREALGRANLLLSGRVGWSDMPLLGVAPPLARALRPLFDGLHRAARARAAATRAPAAPSQTNEGPWFLAAALLGQLASARPRVTARGELHRLERQRLDALFAGPAAARLEPVLFMTAGLGLWGAGADGRVNVDARRAAALFEGSADVRNSRWLQWSFRGGEAACDEVAIGLLARRGGALAREEVARAFRLAEAGRHGAQGTWAEPNRLQALFDRRAERLAEDGILEVEQADGAAHLRLAAPLAALFERVGGSGGGGEGGSGAGAGGGGGGGAGETQRAVCHVQPNFEVIVPPEAGAAAMFALGRFCRLVRLEIVATLKVEADSVRSAAGQGVTADEMTAALAAASAHGVPANVERGVRDFAGTVRRAYVLEGVVVVLPGAEAPPSGSRLHPTGISGVFVSEDHDAGRAMRTLSRAGYAAMATPLGDSGGRDGLEADDDWDGTADDWDGDDDDWDDGDAPSGDDEDDRAAEDDEAGTRRGNASAPGLRLPAYVRRIAEAASAARAVGAVEPLVPAPAPSGRAAPAPARAVGDADAPGPSRAGAAAPSTRAQAPARAERELLRLALLSAPKRWRDHLKEALGDGSNALESVFGLKQTVAEWIDDLLDDEDGYDGARAHALEGFPCCAQPALLGPAAALHAVACGQDLFAWSGDAAGVLRVTPYVATRAPRAQLRVRGHVASGGPDFEALVPAQLVALGPPTAPADRRRFAAERPSAPPAAPPSAARVGRNEPCPCGSGKKYKRCCGA